MSDGAATRGPQLSARRLLAGVTALAVGVVLGCLVAQGALIRQAERDADERLNASARDFQTAIQAEPPDRLADPVRSTTLSRVLNGYLARQPSTTDRAYLGLVDGAPIVLRGGPAVGLERTDLVPVWSQLLESRQGTLDTRAGQARWLAVPLVANGKPAGALVALEFVDARHARSVDAVRTVGGLLLLALVGGALAAWASTRTRRPDPEATDFDPLAELARLFDGTIAADANTAAAGAAEDDLATNGAPSRPHEDGGTPGGPRFRAVDLGVLTDRVLAKAVERAERRFIVESRARLQIVADDDLLRTAMLHLIDNAIASTSWGDTIAVGSSSHHDFVQLWVRDTGRGISDDLRTDLFTPDGTPAPAVTAGEGRSGVLESLAIARAHNGTMAVASREGAGATFMIIVPFDGAHAPRRSIREAMADELLLDEQGIVATVEETIIDVRHPDDDDVPVGVDGRHDMATT